MADILSCLAQACFPSRSGRGGRFHSLADMLSLTRTHRDRRAEGDGDTQGALQARDDRIRELEVRVDGEEVGVPNAYGVGDTDDW